MLYYDSLVADTHQQIINTMIAASLYHRMHNRYPQDVEELVAPELLSAIPAGMTNGDPIHVRPLGNGLVIYTEDELGRIENELRKQEAVPYAVAKNLSFAVFLGEAYEQARQPSADPLSGEGPALFGGGPDDGNH